MMYALNSERISWVGYKIKKAGFETGFFYEA